MKDCCHINFNKTDLIMMLIALFNTECNIYKQEVNEYHSNLFYLCFLLVDPRRGNNLEHATNLGSCYHLLTCACIITNRFMEAIHG